MSQFIYSLITLLSISHFSFADSSIEENLKKLNMRNDVQITIVNNSEILNFKRMSASETTAVDSALSNKNIKRVSDAFMSSDSRFVITLVKDSNNLLMRYISYTYAGKSEIGIDEVIDAKPNEIRTSKGSISVGSGTSLFN